MRGARRKTRASAEWTPAGRYLSERIQAAGDGGDWRGDWVEADIMAALASGAIGARGRLLGFRNGRRGQADVDLLPGSDRVPEWLPVRAVPPRFWQDMIFHGGGWEAMTAWPEGDFKAGGEWWSDVHVHTPRKQSAGRPAKHDWKAIEAFMAEQLADEGGLRPDWLQSDLVREAAEWAGGRWGTAPGDSQLKEHASKSSKEYMITKSRR